MSQPSSPEIDLAAISRLFAIPGDFLGAVPYGRGHINDTYAATYSQAGAPVRYIFQRVNPGIFRDPLALMENIGRVTSHARHRLLASGAGDASRRVLTTLPGHDGHPYARDINGHFWRVYLFIENATGHDTIASPAQARQVARAFGEFQRLCADLPGGRLHETVPDFHHTPRRMAALRQAIAADAHDRVHGMQAEIEFALAREADCSRLVDAMAAGEIPERVTHNDTKLNNVLIDNASGEGICVIDLDTTMPGCALYDFGDMVRSAATTAAEDGNGPDNVCCRLDIFQALADGYLSSAGQFLTRREKAELVFAAKLITFECGVRFLTDFLQGDTYFKTRRPGQNRDRCRNQFALLASMENQSAAMDAIIAGLVL